MLKIIKKKELENLKLLKKMSWFSEQLTVPALGLRRRGRGLDDPSWRSRHSREDLFGEGVAAGPGGQGKYLSQEFGVVAQAKSKLHQLLLGVHLGLEGRVLQVLQEGLLLLSGRPQARRVHLHGARVAHHHGLRSVRSVILRKIGASDGWVWVVPSWFGYIKYTEEGIACVLLRF